MGPDKKNKRLIAPSPAFLRDLKYSAATGTDVAKLTGLSHNTAIRLMSGQPIRETVLARAMDLFYGRAKSELSVIMHSSDCNSISHRKLMRMMKAAATLVQDYKDAIKVSVSASQYWVFQPRLELKNLSDAIRGCYDMLYKLHSECPRYDRVVYQNAKGLLTEFRLRDKDDGSSCIHNGHMSKVQRRHAKRKSCTKTSSGTVQPVDEDNQKQGRGEIRYPDSPDDAGAERRG